MAVELAVEPTLAKAGGGSLPLLEIPSHAVTVRRAAGRGRSGRPSEAASSGRRRRPVPWWAAWPRTRLYLDVLALEEDELPSVAAAVAWTPSVSVGRWRDGSAHA